MTRKVTFIESDTDLIKRIMKYQKEHGLSSFVSAVRKLCNDALEVAKITH